MAGNVCVSAVAGFRSCVLSHVTERNDENQTTKLHCTPAMFYTFCCTKPSVARAHFIVGYIVYPSDFILLLVFIILV